MSQMKEQGEKARNGKRRNCINVLCFYCSASYAKNTGGSFTQSKADGA
jgi:hypothetical protein